MRLSARCRAASTQVSLSLSLSLALSLCCNNTHSCAPALTCSSTLWRTAHSPTCSSLAALSRMDGDRRAATLNSWLLFTRWLTRPVSGVCFLALAPRALTRISKKTGERTTVSLLSFATCAIIFFVCVVFVLFRRRLSCREHTQCGRLSGHPSCSNLIF